MTFERPAPLEQGAHVRIFTASSPFDRERFARGLPLIEARYRVSMAEGLFERSGFLAGSDDARVRALELGLHDSSVDALVAARGGYGATRLLPKIDLIQIRRAKKWLVGFSDVTALHAMWARANLCSIHGPMVCSLADASEAVRSAWFSLLEGATPSPFRNLERVARGDAEGRFFGGNLTVLAALNGTPYRPSLEGTILLLEDISERPYRIDRMLTTMLQAGFFEGVRGIVLGQFTECEPGPDGTTAHDVLCERLLPLGVPIVANAPIGHVPENVPVLLGANAQISGSEIVFTLPS